MTALRQKLPLAGSKSNFRFTPESRLNSEIAACPKSAAISGHQGLLQARAGSFGKARLTKCGHHLWRMKLALRFCFLSR